MQVVLAISIYIGGLRVAAVALALEMSGRPQAALQALHLLHCNCHAKMRSQLLG